jgi:hypothetical protein
MGYNGKLYHTPPVAQWPLPSFLFMVRQLAELLGVHPKFLGLLNLRMCKMKSLHQELEMGVVRSKTTFGESCAGADALGGGRGGFRRSKNSAGRCARKKKLPLTYYTAMDGQESLRRQSRHFPHCSYLPPFFRIVPGVPEVIFLLKAQPKGRGRVEGARKP